VDVIIYPSFMFTESLNRIEKGLNKSGRHVERANERADDIKHHNRRLFTPGIRIGVKGKRDKNAKEHERRMEELEEEHNQLSQRTQGRFRGGSREEREQERNHHESRMQRNYDDSDDDGVQNEIDDNLNYMSGALGRLKMMGMSMQEELSDQNDRLKNINNQADDVNERVKHSHSRLNKLTKKK
jgi:chromosome segregation ATPase